MSNFYLNAPFLRYCSSFPTI